MRGTEVDMGLRALEIGRAERGMYLSRDIEEFWMKYIDIGRVSSCGR